MDIRLSVLRSGLPRLLKAASKYPLNFWAGGMARDTIYHRAVVALTTLPSFEALSWSSDHLTPEAARMIETCLSSYGPSEAVRWIRMWQEKGEPIERNLAASYLKH